MRLLSIVITVLLVATAAAAAGQTLYFVDSAGHVEAVDPQNPGVHGLLPPVDSTGKAGVMFNVSYADVTENTNVGFDDPTYGLAWRERTVEVLNYLASVLSDYTATLDVQFLASEPAGSGSPLAQGGTYFSQDAGWSNGCAFNHITTGVDPSPTTPDIEVTLFYGHEWFYGAGSPPFEQWDFKSVLIHEFTHGLGFASQLTVSGANVVSRIPGTYTEIDRLLTNGNGARLMNDSAQFVGARADVLGQNNGVRFTGPTAVGIFGGPIPMDIPASIQSGGTISHWNSTAGSGLVMLPSISNGAMIREYADIELATLKDIGYSIDMPSHGIEFTSAPTGGGLLEADSALHLAVSFTGAVGTVAYQWQKDGEDIEDATEATFDKDPVTTDDTGWYRCVVTDESKGVYTSPATYVYVYPEGAMPVAGVVSLLTTIALCGYVAARRGKK